MFKKAAGIAALAIGLALPGISFGFGAIAVDDQVGDDEPGYGFVTGEGSADAAKSKAMKECKASGNDNCKVAVWFKNCGAYASGKKVYGYGFGDTVDVAKKKSMEMCGGSCKVVIAECE